MAAKNRGSKEGLVRDPYTNMPSEQKSNESNKQKVIRIHEMFPDLLKDNIVKLLQYYMEEESEVIDAIQTDGGIEALKSFATETGSLKSKSNKNKKKKKKARKDALSGVSSTASFDADDSSSLHSGGNIDADVEKDGQSSENSNGIASDVLVSDVQSHQTSGNVSPVSPISSTDKLISNQEVVPPAVERVPTPVGTHHECEVPSHPSSHNSPEDQGFKKEKFRPVNDHQRHQRQRTSSFRRSQSSVSEDLSSQRSNSSATAVPTKRGFDKCKKDLSRQTISLQRIQSQLEKSFEEAGKKLKTAFADIFKQLQNRQNELESELDKTKTGAFELLKSRQNLAVELKRRVERTPSLTEADWTELRSDVKQFVTERKYDDELGKTIWFQWPDISKTLESFGEIMPVKNLYSHSSHSAAGNSVISNSTNVDPSPSSSVTNEEIKPPTQKDDLGNLSDVADEGVTPKDILPTASHKNISKDNRQEAIRGRTFINSKVYDRNPPRLNHSNYQQGYHRDNRGYIPDSNRGYHTDSNRGYHTDSNRVYSNYNRNNPRHFRNYNDYHHQQQPRGNMYQGDRNMNYHNKGPRGRGRGGNYRGPNNQGYHQGGQRHNNNNIVVPPEHSEPPPPMHVVEEKQVNGYDN